ncbi:MAG: aminotransferase class V-fold PLP-dependent enzyme, partial [Woeseiaceae bacterium]|nr:aminotransferase class V-fold PLP-dependent enzyme [Woeseiaceae bacterium]
MNDADIVYLDYAATTPVEPRVAEHMSKYLSSDGVFANPSAIHVAGRRASEAVDAAAHQLAALLNGDPQRIIWTSGATEANNLAILGVARQRAHRGRHLVTMSTEHKAVTDVFRHLEKSGFEVSWLDPGPDGVLDLQQLSAAIRDDTQLVSVMYVNNETGVIQDIAAIGGVCRERGVLYHVDAAQALGKLPIDVSALPVDLVSLTAHKMHGPKGVGALYVADRPHAQLEPVMYGGGQQRRLRPGTLPVHLIAGFGCAADIAATTMH